MHSLAAPLAALLLSRQQPIHDANAAVAAPFIDDEVRAIQVALAERCRESGV